MPGKEEQRQEAGRTWGHGEKLGKMTGSVKAGGWEWWEAVHVTMSEAPTRTVLV